MTGQGWWIFLYLSLLQRVLFLQALKVTLFSFDQVANSHWAQLSRGSYLGTAKACQYLAKSRFCLLLILYPT